MVLIFELNKEYDTFKDFGHDLEFCILQERQEFSRMSFSSTNLREEERTKLVFSSIVYKCWCSGEYKPKENQIRKRRQL